MGTPLRLDVPTDLQQLKVAPALWGHPLALASRGSRIIMPSSIWSAHAENATTPELLGVHIGGRSADPRAANRATAEPGRTRESGRDESSRDSPPRDRWRRPSACDDRAHRDRARTTVARGLRLSPLQRGTPARTTRASARKPRVTRA